MAELVLPAVEGKTVAVASAKELDIAESDMLAFAVVQPIVRWLEVRSLLPEPAVARFSDELRKYKEDRQKVLKEIKSLSGAQKPKLAKRREELQQSIDEEELKIQTRWLAEANDIVNDVRRLREELEPQLRLLDAALLAERRALVGHSIPALEARCRIFYDGTSDNQFSNFAAYPFCIGALDFPKGEKFFHLVKVLLCGDQEVAWKILNTNSGPDLRRMGREAMGYADLTPELWEDIDAGMVLLVCIIIKVAACTTRPDLDEGKHLKASLVDSARLYIAEGARDDDRCGIGFHRDDNAPLEHVTEWGRNHLGHACMAAARYFASQH